MNDLIAIEAKVINITADSLGIDKEKITPESSFTEDLGADSLDSVELIMALEAEFNCEIPDEDAQKITTVADAINYVKEHINTAKV